MNSRTGIRCAGPFAGHEVANFGGDGTGHEHLTASKVQRSEQVNALPVVRVGGDRGGYERSRVADNDHQRGLASMPSSFRARFTCWVEFAQLTHVGADS